MLTPLLHASLMATILTLLAPFNPLAPHQTTTTHVKAAFMISLIPTSLFIYAGLQVSTLHLIWLPLGLNLKISLLLDGYSTLFTPIALLITWSILEFSQWYMSHDPCLNKFMKYLTLFLLAMLTLTTANNLLQLFIGWEGVGIMSFLLIGWWHGRISATTSALQAVIYNRLGDIGLLLTLVWAAMDLNTWDMHQIFAQHQTTPLPLIGLILAATGKSAQFGLHPWLPAAMEGPTPVSALLHSSTMVVAGIFLLIRLHPLLQPHPFALTACLGLGAVTTTFAAMCALTQNDIKKIIAFSTSSQLGLMMLTIGLNQPTLAFLHITTHAFFKAMLFLGAGAIIHTLNNEQDIRKMGGMQHTLPITTSCMTLGSLALAGTPFLAGFYTKDTILETMNTSLTNAWALTTTLIATTLTAAYSTRLLYYTQLTNPRHSPLAHLAETDPQHIQPLARLATGSIIMGLIVTSTITANQPLNLTMPLALKTTALLLTLIGLLLALDLAHQTTRLTPPCTTTLHTTTTNLFYYNPLTHRHLPSLTLKAAHTALYTNDRMWYEWANPTLATTFTTTASTKLATHHTGLLKTYLTALLLLLSTALLLTLYGTR
uniref:NADH-ubiquinone oxidoreductase chain 5 n=1 Tax=Phyllodactylus unctus TaxID=611294 RepID=K9JW11_9SAUR|nr:NADH dehydrogenase subunit 5 [Phyllodactylus unctus]ADY86066.1 NADH dehydrogenase subunit 5 [Phyllodactylus unctus]